MAEDNCERAPQRLCVKQPESRRRDAGAGASDAAVVAVAPFDRLPEELIRIIFGFVGSRWVLTTTCKVCRAWRHAGFGVPVSISGIKPSTAGLVPTGVDDPGRSFRRREHEELPRNVALFQCSDADTVRGWLLALVSRFRRVRTLPPLTGWVATPFAAIISDSTAIAMLQHCPHLAQIVLGLANPDPTAPPPATAEVVAALAEHCRRLNQFEVWRDDLADPSLTLVARRCRDLTAVTCKATSKITDVALAALGEHCPNLQTLRFACIERDWTGGPASFTITDRGVSALVRGCPLLTELTFVDGAIGVGDEGLTAVGECCPWLMTIRVRCDPETQVLTDVGLVALAQGCPNLAIVSFIHATLITDRGLTAVARCCRNLDRIRVQGASVTNVGVMEMAERCRGLTCVDFTATGIMDAAVRELVTLCPRLRMLDIMMCPLLTDLTVDFLIEQRHRGLVLSMTGSTGISDEGLGRLWSVYPDL
eukprot:m.31172 g.31172  ORF g.31172 m.31172 type:complete len:479 (-) comp6906_c0_seq1:97-1533(-)